MLAAVCVRLKLKKPDDVVAVAVDAVRSVEAELSVPKVACRWFPNSESGGVPAAAAALHGVRSPKEEGSARR